MSLLAPLLLSLACQGTDPAPLRAAWERLEPGAKREVVEWFRYEIGQKGTSQGALVARILDESETDPGLVVTAAAHPFFDPEEHAPKQPIVRRPLDLDDPRVERMRAELFPPVASGVGRLTSAWRYDWGARALVRIGLEDEAPEPEPEPEPSKSRRSRSKKKAPKEPETPPAPEPDPQALERELERESDRLFANALSGYVPDVDLARALVLQRLDQGDEQEALAAFAHAYTDRSGNVYTGITLYDAWSSGKRIEMPDVDALGIVHTLLDEWRRWKAPVPERKHDSLYERIEELFVPAHRYRELREAVADAYFIGVPPPRGGYGPNNERFHALWGEHDSDVDALAELLPEAKDWEKWNRDLVSRSIREPDLMNRGKQRSQLLQRDAETVRATLAWVLQEFGALEK